jgi:hypothetical protein
MISPNDIEDSVIICDPPSGWKYGFPKVIPEEIDNDNLRKWLLDNGYPQHELDKFPDYLPCRFWRTHL